MKIILREFHSSTGAMPAKEEEEEKEEEDEKEVARKKQQFFPFFFLTLPLSPGASTASSSFCFHARRPEGDALKPGCNPGDAIK